MPRKAKRTGVLAAKPVDVWEGESHNGPWTQLRFKSIRKAADHLKKMTGKTTFGTLSDKIRGEAEYRLKCNKVFYRVRCASAGGVDGNHHHEQGQGGEGGNLEEGDYEDVDSANDHREEGRGHRPSEPGGRPGEDEEDEGDGLSDDHGDDHGYQHPRLRSDDEEGGEHSDQEDGDGEARPAGPRGPDDEEDELYGGHHNLHEGQDLRLRLGGPDHDEDGLYDDQEDDEVRQDGEGGEYYDHGASNDGDKTSPPFRRGDPRGSDDEEGGEYNEEDSSAAHPFDDDLADSGAASLLGTAAVSSTQKPISEQRRRPLPPLYSSVASARTGTPGSHAGDSTRAHVKPAARLNPREGTAHEEATPRAGHALARPGSYNDSSRQLAPPSFSSSWTAARTRTPRSHAGASTRSHAEPAARPNRDGSAEEEATPRAGHFVARPAPGNASSSASSSNSAELGGSPSGTDSLSKLAGEGISLGASPASYDSPSTLAGDGSSQCTDSLTYSLPSDICDESIEALREGRNVLRSELQEANKKLEGACALRNHLSLSVSVLGEDYIRAERELKESKRKCFEAKEVIKGLNAQLDALKKESKESKPEASRKIEDLETLLAQSRSEVDGKTQEILVLQSSLANLTEETNGTVAKLEDLLKQKDERIGKLHTGDVEKTKQLESLSLQLEAKNAELETAKSGADAAHGKIADLNTGLADKNARIQALTQELGDSKACAGELRKALEARLANEDERNRELEKAKSKISELETELANKNEEFNRREEKLHSLFGEVAASKAELEKAKSSKADEISELRTELANKNEEITRLESAVSDGTRRLDSLYLKPKDSEAELEKAKSSKADELQTELAKKNQLLPGLCDRCFWLLMYVILSASALIIISGQTGIVRQSDSD